MGRPTQGEVYVQNGRYVIRYQLNGRRVKEFTDCETELEARALVQARVVEARRQHGLPSARPSQSTRILEAMEAWSTGEDRKKDLQRIRGFARWVGVARSVSSVNSADVTDWSESRAATVCEATRARELTVLSAFFRWCVRSRFCPSNPVRDAIRPSAATKKSPEPHAPKELKRVLSLTENEKTFGPVYRLAYFAGLRRGEIVGQRWEDCDLKSGRMLVRGTKSKRSFGWIPLLPELLEWMEPRMRPQGHLVVGTRGRPLAANGLTLALTRWNRSHPKAEQLPNFHECRHTLAYRLIASGFEIHEVAAMLRDSVKMVEQTYGHYSAMTFAGRFESFRVTE